jgi:DNA-binding transcriptional ArsR family regulator
MFEKDMKNFMYGFKRYPSRNLPQPKSFDFSKVSWDKIRCQFCRRTYDDWAKEYYKKTIEKTKNTITQPNIPPEVRKRIEHNLESSYENFIQENEGDMRRGWLITEDRFFGEPIGICSECEDCITDWFFKHEQDITTDITESIVDSLTEYLDQRIEEIKKETPLGEIEGEILKGIYQMKSTRKIAKETEKAQSTINYHIKKFKEHDLIVKDGKKWKLTQAGLDTLKLNDLI